MSFAPRARAAVALLALSLVAVGCGSDDSSDNKKRGADADQRTLVIYSGREEELAGPMYEAFEKKTGIEVEVKYAESHAMAALLREEGDRSPADVFYAQDAGSIGAVADLLTDVPADSLEAVDAEYRDPAGKWVGITVRARTLVYNSQLVKEADLPAKVTDLTNSEWKGAVGAAPTNASFEAFVSGMRILNGDEAAKSFLEGLVSNEVKTYPKNGAIVDAVASGEIKVGLVNRYYLYEKLESDPKAPIANHFFESGDIGNMLNVSAVGILESGKNSDEAAEFVEFVLTDGQTYIVEEAPEREYPIAKDFDISSPRYQELTPIDELNAPDVSLENLADELEDTVAMITETGLRQ